MKPVNRLLCPRPTPSEAWMVAIDDAFRAGMGIVNPFAGNLEYLDIDTLVWCYEAGMLPHVAAQQYVFNAVTNLFRR